MDSSDGDEGQVQNQKVEYDHFDPEQKIVYPVLPEEIVAISKEKSIREFEFGVGLGRFDLLKILRRKLLEHNWNDVTMIMEGLAKQAIRRRSALSDVFWKVGNEVLYNHPDTAGEEDLVFQHKEAVMQVHTNYVDQTQVLFEYALHLMTQREFEKAREALKFFRNIRGRNGRKEKILKNLEEWTPVIEGYLGMLDYISWKEMASELKSRSDFEADVDNQGDPAAVAEEAIAHFETTLATPGVWDIFVTKYTDMMEHFGRISEAEETLKGNSMRNQKNPNAHKYWYEFLLRHPEIGENAASRTQALSSLHEVAPSDIYMLDLHFLRMDAAFKVDSKSKRFVTMASLALEILLDMLDYGTWLQHEKSWRLLAGSLLKVKKATDEKTFQTMLRTVWTRPMRHTWWPKYHFTKRRASEAMKLHPDFAKSKSFIAKVLVGKQCEFCEYVSQNEDDFRSPRKRRRMETSTPVLT